MYMYINSRVYEETMMYCLQWLNELGRWIT